MEEVTGKLNLKTQKLTIDEKLSKLRKHTSQRLLYAELIKSELAQKETVKSFKRLERENGRTARKLVSNLMSFVSIEEIQNAVRLGVQDFEGRRNEHP